MVNLEGFRKLNELKFNIKYNINEKIEEIKSSSFQLYNNCEEIINKFGDFSKEINIFKNTARKGMIFSDTKYVTDVDIHNVIPLEDEKIGEYIITDGIGKISTDLINLSAQKWGITDLNKKPLSAIQIRFMGCKGVFAVDPYLQKNTVHYRESQKKFESDDVALNICSVANYKEGFLNRQFIILLNSLGVEDNKFLKIQNKVIKRYINLVHKPLKALANDNSLYYEFKHKLSYFIPTFETFYKQKIDLLNEPLFSQFINLFIYSNLITMKYSGRLNDRKCVCLMGVIDETNTLEEDEVYVHLVNYSECSNVNKILEQNIIVYRSPSLHPGDIKILKAVNNSFLEHMKNVIVFSKKGERPVFNKMSGGDLDGDRYFISFNESLANKIKDKNIEPLEDLKYSDKNNKNIKKEKISIEDSINCMIKSTSNDVVGLLCDNHMAFADKSLLKAKDPKCIKLCKYFNQEIDASKTGNFIDVSTLKEENLIMEKRPDFLSNGNYNDKKNYESPGILGKLYRNIDRKRLYNNFGFHFFKKAIRREYEVNYNYITKDCFKYLADAFEIYNDYKIKLCNLMKKYNFCTESEIFLNIRVFKGNRGYRGKSDSYNIELKDLIDYIHDKIIQKFHNINKDISSAIYVASYINIRRVYEKKVFFSEDFDENVAKLMSLFETEKNDFQILFNHNNKYVNFKQKHKGDNKNKYKRIFSLPWVIKEIRNFLLNI